MWERKEKKKRKKWKPPFAGLGCLVPHADHEEGEHWGFLVCHNGSGLPCWATGLCSQGMWCWRWCLMSPGRNPACSPQTLSVFQLLESSASLLLSLAPVPVVSPA